MSAVHKLAQKIIEAGLLAATDLHRLASSLDPQRAPTDLPGWTALLVKHGLLTGLKHLHALPKLRTIRVQKTAVTPTGVEALRRVFPKIEITGP